MMVPEERFETYARGRPYHAALVDLRGDSSPHGHLDYYEVMVVAEGAGEQRLPTGTQRLRRGDIALVRPGDQHGITGAGPEGMRFYNIAFPAATWHGFTALAALDQAAAWDAAALPPFRAAAPAALAAPAGAALSGGSGGAGGGSGGAGGWGTDAGMAGAAGDVAVEACRVALERFHDGPTTLDLVSFWTRMVPLLPTPATAASGAPDWLAAACAAMRQEENLRAGLPRMLALAHVSPAHLSRTMRRHYRTTPSAWLTELRLRHAAHLLAATDEPVTAIAARCGFTSPSYFTRCFRAAYATSPRTYRPTTRRAFVP